MEKRTLKRIGIVVACLAAGVFALAGFVMLSLKGVSTRPATGTEKQMVVTADALARFIDIPGDRALCETVVVRRNLDGSQTIEYEYDAEKDPNADGILFVMSEVELSTSLKMARDTFSLSAPAFKAGKKLGAGTTFDEDDSLFTLGDENYASVVLVDGDPVGNVIVTRKGQNVHSLMMFGAFMNQREYLEDLIGPTLR